MCVFADSLGWYLPYSRTTWSDWLLWRLCFLFIAIGTIFFCLNTTSYTVILKKRRIRKLWILIGRNVMIKSNEIQRTNKNYRHIRGYVNHGEWKLHVTERINSTDDNRLDSLDFTSNILIRDLARFFEFNSINSCWFFEIKINCISRSSPLMHVIHYQHIFSFNQINALRALRNREWQRKRVTSKSR